MNRYSLISLLAAITTFGLFVMEWRGMFKPVGHPFAQLQSVQGTVKRMGADALSWDRCEEGTLLEEGDTIVTAEDSTATLKFLDSGSELELSSGAMVVLVTESDDLFVNVISGQGVLRVDENSPNNPKVRESKERKGLAGSIKVTKRGAPRVSEQSRNIASVEKGMPQTQSETLMPLSKKIQAEVPTKRRPTLEVVSNHSEFVLQNTGLAQLKSGQFYELSLYQLDESVPWRVLKASKSTIRIGDLPLGRYNWELSIIDKKGKHPVTTATIRVIAQKSDSSAPKLRPVSVNNQKPVLEKVMLEDNRPQLNKAQVK